MYKRQVVTFLLGLDGNAILIVVLLLVHAFLLHLHLGHHVRVLHHCLLLHLVLLLLHGELHLLLLLRGHLLLLHELLLVHALHVDLLLHHLLLLLSLRVVWVEAHLRLHHHLGVLVVVNLNWGITGSLIVVINVHGVVCGGRCMSLLMMFLHIAEPVPAVDWAADEDEEEPAPIKRAIRTVATTLIVAVVVVVVAAVAVVIVIGQRNWVSAFNLALHDVVAVRSCNAIAERGESKERNFRYVHFL